MKRLPILLALLALACNLGSPTEPATAVVPVEASLLRGEWVAAFPISPGGQDWSEVVLRLDASGDTVTGVLTTRAGTAHSVAGAIGNGRASFRVGELPNNPSIPCFMLSVLINEIELRDAQRVAFMAQLQGRCPNTLAQSVRFRFIRA